SSSDQEDRELSRADPAEGIARAPEAQGGRQASCRRADRARLQAEPLRPQACQSDGDRSALVSELCRPVQGTGAVSESIWFDPTIVFEVHAEQLALFGGADGVRELGLLESALGRPLNKFAYGETSLAALAAAYAFGIARNQPFNDGNKRAAVALIIVFL